MKVISRLSIGILIGVISALLLATSAFAATSVQYGWIALDANKKPVLQGSQYPLSGAVKPIAYITDGVKTVTVNNKAVVYLDNSKVGTAQALIIGENIIGYQDAFITKFTIIKAATDIAKATIDSIPNKNYTGKAITPTVTVKMNGKALSQNKDYTLHYINSSGKKVTPKEPGTYKAVVTGKGNYKGTKTVQFQITAETNLAKATIAKMPSYYTHGLAAVTPNPTVKLNNKTLKKGTDYTVSYTDKNGKKTTPKKPGTYKAVVTGKGIYNGSKTVSFKLVNMNEDLARTACKLAYSTGHYYSGGSYPGTKKYLKAFYAAGSAQEWVKGRSCDAGVFTAVKTSKYDSKFPSTCAGQSKYFNYSGTKTKTSKWEYVGKYTGKVSTSNLLPGDIMYAAVPGGGCHIIMYVGNGIAKDVYNKSLKKTDADTGTPTGSWVSAHYGGGLGKAHNAAFCICGSSWSLANNSYYKGKWKIYRCVKPDKAVKKSHGGVVK